MLVAGGPNRTAALKIEDWVSQLYTVNRAAAMTDTESDTFSSDGTERTSRRDDFKNSAAAAVPDDKADPIASSNSVSKKNGISKQQLDYEIKKLEPDSRGWYTIRFPKPDDDYKPEDAQEEFKKYGEVAEKHFTAKFIYIRFAKKGAAIKALKEHSGERDLEVPRVSREWKKEAHGEDGGPQLYVGNISPHASKAEVKSLFIPYKMRDFKFYKISNRTFAFVYVQTANDAKRAIKEVNGRKLKDTTLVVTLSRDRSRTRVLAGDDEESFRSEVELYIANFKWGTTLYEIRQLLEPFGFKSVRLDTRSEGQCNKAFALMWSLESALQAVNNLNQMTWYGQRIFVTLWSKEEKRPLRSDELEQLQFAEENNRKMNYGIERAVILSQRLDAMIDDVIDECYYCTRVRSMMTELNEVIQTIQYTYFNQGSGQPGPSGPPSLLGAAPVAPAPLMAMAHQAHAGGATAAYMDAVQRGFGGGAPHDMYGNGTHHKKGGRRCKAHQK